MRDKTFLSAGFGIGYNAGYEIKIEQTSFRMQKRTKKQLLDAGNDLIFSRDTESLQPHREPVKHGVF